MSSYLLPCVDSVNSIRGVASQYYCIEHYLKYLASTGLLVYSVTAT